MLLLYISILAMFIKFSSKANNFASFYSNFPSPFLPLIRRCRCLLGDSRLVRWDAVLLWLHGRESQDLSNAVVVGQEHHHSINAHTPTTGGRETVLEGLAKGLIDALSLVITLGLLSGLLLKSLTLLRGNVQLGVAILFFSN